MSRTEITYSSGLEVCIGDSIVSRDKVRELGIIDSPVLRNSDVYPSEVPEVLEIELSVTASVSETSDESSQIRSKVTISDYVVLIICLDKLRAVRQCVDLSLRHTELDTGHQLDPLTE